MSQLDAMVEKLIVDIEGEVGTVEGDEPTVWGLSSKYHADLVSRYNQLSQEGDKAGLMSLRAEAKAIYVAEYISVIPEYRWMDANFPALLSLLFIGRVHGTGYRDYVVEVQLWLNRKGLRLIADGRLGPRTLKGIKGLSLAERDQLIAHLKSPVVAERLIMQRQKAVRRGGSKNADRGIRNRVLEELSYAETVHKDYGAMVAFNTPAPPLVVTRGADGGSQGKQSADETAPGAGTSVVRPKPRTTIQLV